MNKIEKLRAAMKVENIDAAVITSELNQRYLCGFPFTDGMIVVTADEAYMITDFRYYEEAGKAVYPGIRVEMPDDRAAFLKNALRDCARVGYEDETLACAELARMKEKYGFNFVPLGNTLETIREVKDEEEVTCMAEAQRLTDAAFAHILTAMTPTMTERDVALELEFFMRKNGAEGLAFETICVSGNASALPHGKARDIRLQKGFLTMDFGAYYKGYCADMTRTVVLGKADAEMKRLYETVLKAQLAGIASVAPGKEGWECDKVARDIIDGAGYEGCFGHSLGHGVGMFIHENPRLAKSGHKKLVPGNVVTVEPGIYRMGEGGCRIEDMVLVTEGGCRDFTQSPKELIELF